MINTAKRLSALALALMLILGSVTLCFAETASNSGYVIDDTAGLFEKDEVELLKTRLENASKQTGWQFIIHTDNSKITVDSLRDFYVESYYEKHKEFSDNAVVLVINSAINRGTYFAMGEAKYALNDGRVNELSIKLKVDMDKKAYYQTAVDFTDRMVGYYNKPTAEAEKREGKLVYVLKHYWWLFAIIAVVAGGATFGITAGKYKYNGKFNTYDLNANSETMLDLKQDMFVTKHTTSRVIQTNSGSSGSSHSSGSGGSRGGDF
ncbi:MAG TPA: hypothetical protein DEO32_02480 [Ruminococcaceae bacterium]|nr:hypothetical protein [Oscillospiraceae bacterium]